MVYYAIGLMSGSSLDGLDICYAEFEEIKGEWDAQIVAATTIPYSEEWKTKLLSATTMCVADFIKLHTAYGKFIGQEVSKFISRNNLIHKVHFIASHGHTVFHEPHNQATFQLGDGASITAETGLPVISDLRNMDVALGGQGAPIVPIGDKLLFCDFDILINIGGIANLSIKNDDNKFVAFDICVANQALNYLSQKEGNEYDLDGVMAASGSCLNNELAILAQNPYYATPAPKSLSNTQAMLLVQAFLDNEKYTTADKLNTICHLISLQISNAIKNYSSLNSKIKTATISGGGVLNKYLSSIIKQELSKINVALNIPDDTLIQYKEALVMALIGILRWREESNVLSDISGASRDSIGGALWIP